MALCGFSMTPSIESVELSHFNGHWRTTLIRPSCVRSMQRSPCSTRRQSQEVRCSSSRKAASPIESETNSLTAMPVSGEEEPGDVTRFKMSDFKVLDRVSVGLAGKV